MTAASYFALSCDTYKQNIFSGFTRLQEQQEFVDLTLAADGHIVKVHKNIMALASPYIKELLKSTSSDNPVIFLNNVRHNILKYLLEYIYQGEVNIPQDCIEPFMQLSQSLHITGIGRQNIHKNDNQKCDANENLGKSIQQDQDRKHPTIMSDGTYKDIESSRNVAACITINNDHNVEVKQFDNKQILNIGSSHHSNMNNGNAEIVINADTIQAMPVVVETDTECPVNVMENDVTMSQDDQTDALFETNNFNTLPKITILSDFKVKSENTGLINLNLPINLDKEAKDALKRITQYTLTERGAVQIIVGRYVYSSHHSSRGGRKHRWRCIDYRQLRCPAFIDSLDNQIISRKGIHSHKFHDDRIYKKHENGKIFHSYKQAEEAWKLPSENHSDLNTEEF